MGTVRTQTAVSIIQSTFRFSIAHIRIFRAGRLLLTSLMGSSPLLCCRDTVCPMLGVTPSNLNQYGRVHRIPRHNCLARCEPGKLTEYILTGGLDTIFDRILISGVLDFHRDLCPAL